MSNRNIVAHIVGAVAIACVMPFLVLVPIYFLIPEIYPSIKLYIGLVALIGLNVAVVLGYVRYQQWRSFKDSGAQQPDRSRESAKHRPF